MTLEYLLDNRQLNAIKELKNELKKNFHVYDIVLFGSVARKEANEESDLDLLLIIKENTTHEIRNNISDIVFEINLKHGTNISIVVIEKNKWEKGFTKLTPFYKEIQKDGVFINEYL
ncbi:MAG: nucleotidyltransferase family protein [bacterium]